MHVLGFAHEHQRPDRNHHVKIFDQNIIESSKGQYDIIGGLKDFGIPYDIDSIMHGFSTEYRKSDIISRLRYLTTGNQYTILTKNGNTIGFNSKLSFKDEAKIRRAYGCKLTVHPCP